MMRKDDEHELNCPHCGESIEISDLLATQIRNEIQHDFENARDNALRKQQQLFDKDLEKHKKDIEAKQSIEMADLQAQLIEQSQVAATSQQKELELRKQARELEQKQQQVEIELQRRLDAEKNILSTNIREQLTQEFSLTILEKEKQIEDLRKSVNEVKRKSDQGSQELQGELLELDIEQKLSLQFPEDTFNPVSKGVRGADICQDVIDHQHRVCGQIIWEVKNTKNWSQSWVEKLKQDQRSIGATFAILVTTALPTGLQRFGLHDGIWVSDVYSYIGLATAFRKYLIDIEFAHIAAQGKNDKVDMIYRYLSGEEFKNRIEAIVESFNSLQLQLIKERRAMEKIWKDREKQIEKMTLNTVGMYGEMQGIIGSSLPTIPALELDPDER